MNFRISGQKINIMKETKYLRMIMDEHLTSENHMDTKQSKWVISQVRHYVNLTLLRTICYAISEPHLRYGCQLWGQTQTQVLQNIEEIQNKALRVIILTNSREPNI